MKFYQTEASKKKKAHYVPAMEHAGILYVSGQLSIDLRAMKLPEGGARAHARQALANLDEVLRLAGAKRQDVLMCRVYTPDVAFWDEIDDEYAKFFGEHKPARVVVPTSGLHFGCLVEIEATVAMSQRTDDEI
ncbi:MULTISPECIES: RidA family protein [Campylobacter]|uniref:Reactive intermediate/imine deaminase n=1 Tax=Campylobacter curvus (strain 525.92) TaxID=360105 RepID=A7GZD4_CAMC5|nr:MULTISPECIES: RidA family protein [Campylobacter]EAU01253.1 reactive intermediate/imine deaminase [Campylobacter curvus 525.92]EJP74191.1 endoribonuclease L-PSP [Campylobacter sp. FOBRC14]